MPGIPKVAYVVYNDGYRGIVDVKRIKDFSPRTVADVAKDKEVYWKTEAGGKIEEDFFPGEVVLLGANFNDLVAKMAKKRWAVPDNIFYETEPEENVSTRKRKKAYNFTIEAYCAPSSLRMNTCDFGKHKDDGTTYSTPY
ncbi:hypothetical protein HPB52_005788 [Rhipicephalus sanguineus]|uniref:Uncharacterized protein n=1 Tax=Rhipicephalus sanguineus TaxID=34632 RepID=A0A9D4PUV3_RHISA|nr:hypothetical protein HPB52_005788 [Rhipicephalus sanguineus]